MTDISATSHGSNRGRQALAFVSAVLTWGVVATILNRLLRTGLTGYAAAEPAMDFSLPMQFARLALGALASLCAGYVIAHMAPHARRLPLIFGSLMVVMFLPVHYDLWNKFPIWYHLFFLLTIIPFVMAGARIAGRKTITTRD